jgi:hypothetical protein
VAAAKTVISSIATLPTICYIMIIIIKKRQNIIIIRVVMTFAIPPLKEKKTKQKNKQFLL